jgi:hypothetical protein
MTTPDPRLEAVAKAIYESDATREGGGDWLSWERLVKIGSYDVDEYRYRARAAQDAINAFDAQRQPMVDQKLKPPPDFNQRVAYETAPAASPVGAVSLTETMAAVTTEAANAIRRSFKQSSPVGADPPPDIRATGGAAAGRRTFVPDGSSPWVRTDG